MSNIDKPYSDIVLKHWGVKGMKWGVRKDRKPQGYQGPGYQGRKISGVVATRTIGTDFSVNPTMNITKSPETTTEEKKYLAQRTRENAEKALSSPELHQEIKAVNEKHFGTKDSPKTPKNSLEKGYYYADYVRALNNEFSKYSDMKNSMISVVEPIMNENLDIVGFEYLYGDQPYVDQIVRHEDKSPRGGKLRIGVVKNTKTGMIERLTLGKSIKHSEVDAMAFTEEFLAHWGVKGMKWGVRKDRKPQGYQGKSGPADSSDFDKSEKKKTIRLTKNRKVSSAPVRTDISTAELRKINERLRLELDYNRQVSELRRQNRTKIERVRETALEVIGESAKKSATQLLSSQMTTYGQQLLNRERDMGDTQDDRSNKKKKKK